MYLSFIDCKKIWLAFAFGTLLGTLRADPPPLSRPTGPCPNFSAVLPHTPSRVFLADNITRPSRGDLAFVFDEGVGGGGQYQEALVGRFLPKVAGEPVANGEYQVFFRDSSGAFTRESRVRYFDFSTRNQREMGNLHPYDRRFPDPLAKKAEAVRPDGSRVTMNLDPNFELATGRATLHLAPIQGGGPLGFTISPIQRSLARASGQVGSTARKGDIVLVPASKLDSAYSESEAFLPVKIEGFTSGENGEILAVVADPRMENSIYPRAISVNHMSATPKRLDNMIDRRLQDTPVGVDAARLPAPYREPMQGSNEAFKRGMIEWARRDPGSAREYLSELSRSSVINRNLARVWRNIFLNAQIDL